MKFTHFLLDQFHGLIRLAVLLPHAPDKGFRKSDEARVASERIFRAAREAYEILLDPQRRREFDSGTGEFAAPNV